MKIILMGIVRTTFIFIENSPIESYTFYHSDDILIIYYSKQKQLKQLQNLLHNCFTSHVKCSNAYG